MIKAVLFDLDGTVLNTIEDLTISVNYALVKNGYSERTIDDILRFIGNGVWKLLQRALPPNTERKIIDDCLEDFKQHYNIHKSDHTQPYPGIIEMLKQLKKDGYKLAIVSNKYYQAVNELCQVFYPTVQVFIGEGPFIPKKPDPTGTQVAMHLLGVQPHEVIYVGDSPVDYELAQAAGCHNLLVTWGFAPLGVLETFNVPLASNCNQLYDLIKKES